MKEISEENLVIIAYAEAKIRSYANTVFICLGGALLIFVMDSMLHPTWDTRLPFYTLFGVGLLARAGMWITYYRLMHGLLGNNAYEAREIIKFETQQQKNSKGS